MKKATLEEKKRMRLAWKSFAMIWKLVATELFLRLMKKIKAKRISERLIKLENELVEAIERNHEIIFSKEQ